MIAEGIPSGLPNLRGYWLWLARVIWVLLALLYISFFILGTVEEDHLIRTPCIALSDSRQAIRDCFITEDALHQLDMTWDSLANFYTPIATVAALPLILIGCLVFWRKSGNIVALLFSMVLVMAGSTASPHHGNLLRSYPDLLIPVAFLRSLGNMIPVIIFCLFPDGRFVPPWTRWLLLVCAVLNLYDAHHYISTVFTDSYGYSLWDRHLYGVFNILLIIAGGYAMIFRYRHDAGPIQRRQIKWVIVAMVIGALFQIGYAILWQFYRPGFFDLFIEMVYEPLWFMCFLFAAICFGVSISLYRLWDIDFLINRTLVYSLLTAFIVGIYVIVVGILGTAIQGRSNLLISVLATGLVAVLVQPLRDRLQRGINRLMYGERDDPVTVLSDLGKRLENTIAPDAILPTLTETIAQSLRLPYVAIHSELDRDDEVAVSCGQPAGDLIWFPLTHHGATIGQLVVAPRSPGEALSPLDRHLLENIAYQAGMTVHAVNLTADLQDSRQRLVTTREEERRRLRRDLHDGLGPNLASQGLKLAAVKQLAKKDPSSAIPLLEQVMTQNQSTVEEVRRLVYGLRPPALDELGLVAAIRDYVSGMDGKSGLQFEILEPVGGLPVLSAAVEVAAYRIVLEAVTNITRHAQAMYCMIQFMADQKDAKPILQIVIQDDGKGMSMRRRVGVGLRSMRERAEELSGTCMIESSSGNGTRVCVQIPLIVS